MKCEAAFKMMDELIEGELDDSLGREAIAHMAMCGPCSQLYSNLRAEQELFRKYLLEVEPTPALWANLRFELEEEKIISAPQPQFQLQRWLAIALGRLNVTRQMAAALVLITVGLAIGIMVWRTTTDTSRHQSQNSGIVVQPSSEVNRQPADRDSDVPEQRVINDNERRVQPTSAKRYETESGRRVNAAGRAGKGKLGRAPVVPTVDQAVLAAEREYLSAIKILSRDIKRRRDVIPPALLSQLETALAEADRNIAATLVVARQQPRDPVAVQYLGSAYENKVDLLRKVASW